MEQSHMTTVQRGPAYTTYAKIEAKSKACISATHLLPPDVQTEQGDEAADLQQKVNKDSQAGKERERPHGRHVGQSSCRETKETHKK